MVMICQEGWGAFYGYTPDQWFPITGASRRSPKVSRGQDCLWLGHLSSKIKQRHMKLTADRQILLKSDKEAYCNCAVCFCVLKTL